MSNLATQYEITRRALKAAKPRSTRATAKHRELVNIQLRRLRQDIKAGRAVKP